MGIFSVLGIIVAVVAVVAAYYVGYSSGQAAGRNEGFDQGKQEGSRESSMRAYAVGFDRGKRAGAQNDDEGDDDDGEATSNKGIMVAALVLGLVLFCWLSSQKGVDANVDAADASALPRVNRSLSSASSPAPEDFSLQD